MIGTILGTIAIVGVTIVIGVFVERKLLPKQDREPGETMVRISRSKALAKLAPGEMAAVAIRAGAAQLATLRTTQRCRACRTALVAAGDDERVRFDDRDLLVLSFRCPACELKRSLYVEPVL